MGIAAAMPVSINNRIIDKNLSGDKRWFSAGWLPYNLDLAELAESVDQGYAFGPQFHNGQRLGKNFLASGFLAIDADGGLSLNDALNDTYIQRFGGLWYKTPSHGKDRVDRFRVVFVMEKPITSGPQFRAAMLGLAEKFKTDPAIAHAACMLYGARGSQPTILGGVLPDDEVKVLIKLGRAIDDARRSGKWDSEEIAPDERITDGTIRSNREVPADLLIRSAKGGSATIWELPFRESVYCPFHDDKRPSAFILRSELGDPGLCCMACRRTWWAPNATSPAYDFYWFDTVVRRWAEACPEINARRIAKRLPPSNKEARVINEEYLPDLELREGFTLVKSPKGSGKTTALKKLVALAKLRGLSVLLIGHRQILLRDLADRLALECYMDDEFLTGDQIERPDYYAVSVDSLPRRLQRPRPYDIVIVDECEQVFGHLIAKTLKNGPAVMTRLQTYIGDATSLYLFDADLNHVTLNFVSSARKKNPAQPALLLLNTYIAENRVCELYARQTDLIVDMIKAAHAGKRLFIACNSKRLAKRLARMITKELGPKARVLLVTADEKVEQEVQDFLADIPNKILQYNAVVASPAIGTGIDITFPGRAQMIDVVYGFFNSGINSHYEVDQQLGRVRNPKEVKVWMCGQKSRFEMELDAIKLDLIQTGDAHPAVRGHTFFGPDIDMNHPLLVVQASAYCAQRASQNRMKDYFISHKERNGWKIILIGPMKGLESEIMEHKLKRLKAEIEQEYIAGIVAATMIDELAWKAYFDRKAAGEAIGLAATYEMAKFEIRHFYNTQVTAALVELDDHGQFREAVKRYESLYIHNADYLKLLHDQWRSYSDKQRNLTSTLGSRPVRSLEAILIASRLVDEHGICGDKILTKADLKGFLALCDERRATIERDLDVNLREDRHRDPVKTLNLCLSLIGLAMDCLGKKRNGETTQYRYQLDSVCLDTLTKILERRKDGNRSTLPEDLEPPRPRARRKAANDNEPAYLDWLASKKA